MADIYSSMHMKRLVDTVKLKERIRLAKVVLETFEFDTLAFRGMSGTFLGPILALEMRKDMILVRKPGERSHSRHTVEGNKDAGRYIIVDDFVSSGATKAAIVEAVSEFAPDACFVGLLEVNYITERDIEESIGEGLPYPLR